MHHILVVYQRSVIPKINNVLIDNAEDLDTAMPMYNLLEYNKNYLKTTRKFVELLQR